MRGVDFYRNPYFLLFCILLVYIIGWNIHLMEIDAAQYAALSMEMLQSGDFLKVHLRGENYLDKPPLTFWLTALSFSLFGTNEIAARIPSFVFTLLAFYSTFRLSRLYYDQNISLLSVLILGSSQAYFLMNHDCRTDTILTGSVIFSIWQMAAYLKFKKWKHIIGSGVAIGLSLLTKGPMGLVIPILAFGPHILLQRDFKSIFDWKWLIAITISGILLIPMSIGLYQQYGMYGLRFYYWIQSFGRITGESSWDNGTDIFFLLQNHLWSFAPFIVFFFPAIFISIKNIVQAKFYLGKDNEGITLFGFILPFAAFSTSHYQLPHYIFVLYPLASIFTARYVINTFQHIQNKRWINGIQYILLFVYFSLILYLNFYCFPEINYLLAGYFLMCGALAIILILKHKDSLFIIYFSILFYTWVNLGLNSFIYPKLLKFQTGSEVAILAKKMEIPPNKIICYLTDGGFAMDFYLKTITPKATDADFITTQNVSGNFIYTNADGLQKINQAGYKTNLVYEGEDYHVTTLTPKFLNPSTRAETTEKKYLLEVRK